MPNKTSIQLNTLNQLNEYFLHHFIFTYNYGCQINFYTNKKILFDSVYSNDYLPSVFIKEKFYQSKQTKLDNFMSLFNKPNQYYSALHYWHRDFMHKHRFAKFAPVISFAEVYHTSPTGTTGFIARHFIRKKNVVPVVSYIENRSDCQYIKSSLISNEPILNWKSIISDSMFNNKKREINLKEFVSVYERKSTINAPDRVV